MQTFVDGIVSFSNWLWGIPMMLIIVGGSLIMTFSLDFFQFRYFGYILKQTFGKMFSKESKGKGVVSPFAAATAALASSIGASNIVGVPVAIAFGGPGAVFWMWIMALLGSATKFSEVVLGIKYREKNEKGDYIGGPMYYLKKGITPFLGSLFAFCLMIEIVPSVATQAASAVQTAGTLNIPNWIGGLILAILVGLVVYGGIRRIAQVTEKLVPFMSLLYTIGALIVIFSRPSRIIPAFGLIFKHAFTPIAAKGGFLGAGVAQAIRWGTARGVYSNEAGMGTAPIAHSTAIVDHPVRQGIWGIFEVIVSTLIICTITALLVITTGLYETVPAAEAGSMPALAFQDLFGNVIGGGIVTLAMFLFTLSTIIVIVFYGETQAEYLFGSKFAKVMRLIYLVAIFLGTYGGIEFLYNFLDILLATVCIPNVIGIVMLRDEVKDLKNDFFNNPKYFNVVSTETDKQ